jgi:hypothetical protein
VDGVIKMKILKNLHKIKRILIFSQPLRGELYNKANHLYEEDFNEENFSVKAI